jgi:hypothetical protein
MATYGAVCWRRSVLNSMALCKSSVNRELNRRLPSKANGSRLSQFLNVSQTAQTDTTRFAKMSCEPGRVQCNSSM